MGVVEKGDTIYIPANTITEHKVKVEWQQNLAHKTQDYYSVPFFNKTQGDEQGVIFISTAYLDEFKAKKTGGEDLTIVVDESFQYGQNKEKTTRWLAFHDKSMKAFQWRFVASAKQAFGDKLSSFAGGFLKTYIMVDISALSGFLGDPLRNF
ncbi:hypothetical protein GLAREA_12021 [Glarea lozoyensis ATCC 20868]|uniref:Uncharacterized protein n=2 Tax=Glarea lozoyensis TaxID=101852 RepID=S3D495_GLAL2|nr:uncharacterized protein GLAREA_12021 [Glarea lozoyensis ATCC 20868]EHK97521.1 hypothetical protein M7I_6731 [Glarea lozoyensis 74030]EPE31939.1 hypothetical protein GLAREA_12021 [Glarea lozoyensis ATCC 20868]